MKFKKCMAGLLAVCLTMSMAVTAGAAEAAPTVTLETVIVNENILEVGLNIKGDATQVTGLKSLGAILKFDQTRITPVEWGTDTQVTLKQIDLGTEAPWSQYSVVPSKGCANIAAKPALAFTNTQAGGKSYIYLGAVSFDEAVVANGRVVTVRFKTVGDFTLDATALAGMVGKAGSLIGFAGTDATAESIITRMIDDDVICTVGANAYSNKRLTSADATYTALTVDASAGSDGSWTPPAPGESAEDSGSKGGIALTFLDWDGSLIDTATLPSTDANAKTALDTMMELAAETKTTALGKALGGKQGYDFDCWLNYNEMNKPSNVNVPFTSNDATLIGNATATPYIIDQTKLTTYAGAEGDGNTVRTGYTVQAAYVANANCVMDGNYSFNKDDFYYTRYAGATDTVGKYSITLDMNRGALRRAVQPGLRIAMEPKAADSQKIYSFQRAVSSDKITFEVVPTKDMKELSIELVETNGFSTWISAKSISGSTAAGTISMSDVVKYGSANFIMEQAIQFKKNNVIDWNDNVDVLAFNDAGFPNITSANLAAAKTAVLSHFTADSAGVDTYANFAAWVSAIH